MQLKKQKPWLYCVGQGFAVRRLLFYSNAAIPVLEDKKKPRQFPGGALTTTSLANT